MRKTRLTGQIVSTLAIICGLAGTASISSYADEAIWGQPMQLRLTLKEELSQVQLEAINSARDSIDAGEKEKARSILNSALKSGEYKKSFQLSIFQNGKAQLEISNGAGGWPGFPVNNTDWETRSLSPDMQRGLHTIIERCREAEKPVYYRDKIYESDIDISKGLYEVACLPGTAAQLSELSLVDLAKSYLASEDIPLEDRQGNMGWMMSYALMDNYVRNTPRATLKKDTEECVRIMNVMKRDYTYSDQDRSIINRQIEKCPKADYNWVRRRAGIPEIK